MERLEVVRGPPVLQVTVGIELAPLIIESVCVLVPNHHADSAEVYGVVEVAIKEGRLENASREHDLVVRGIVVGVYRGRRHAPERAVGWLVDALIAAPDLEYLRASGVPEKVIPLHLHRAVVLPRFWVADLARAEGLELGERFCPRLRGHPGQALDVLTQCGRDRFDHLTHACLAPGAEGLLHVELTEGVAQRAVGGLDAALPTRLHFLGPVQVLAVKAEVFLHKGRTQIGSGRAHYVPPQVGLPVRKGGAVHEAVGLHKVLPAGQVDALETPRPGGDKVGVKVEGGRERFELLDRHRVVTVPRIAHGDAVQVRLRQLGLDS